jgi:hypothetical protein
LPTPALLHVCSQVASIAWVCFPSWLMHSDEW